MKKQQKVNKHVLLRVGSMWYVNVRVDGDGFKGLEKIMLY